LPPIQRAHHHQWLWIGEPMPLVSQPASATKKPLKFFLLVNLTNLADLTDLAKLFILCAGCMAQLQRQAPIGLYLALSCCRLNSLHYLWPALRPPRFSDRLSGLLPSGLFHWMDLPLQVQRLPDLLGLNLTSNSLLSKLGTVGRVYLAYSNLDS